MSSMVYLRGVSHEMLPVLLGYRLSLIYKFSDYKERLSNIKSLRMTFARVLSTWKAGAVDSAPRVMIYLLESGCSKAGPLVVGDLAARDLLQVKFARDTAREIGIGYGIGRMKYVVMGEVVDDRTPSESRMHYRIDGEDDVWEVNERPHEIDYDEPTTVSITLTNVSDMEGKVVDEFGSTDLDEDNLITPDAFQDEEEPDEQDFGGFSDMGYGVSGLSCVLMLHCLI